MNKLDITLENCFGINSLTGTFNFSKHRSVLIYAPNGTMKSSFAKTFECLAKGEKPQDRICPKRETIASVLSDGEPIDTSSILIADAETDINTTDKVTTLLASKDLKKQYDNIYQQLESSKSNFIKELKNISQSSDCEAEIVATFRKSNKDDLFSCLEGIKEEVANAKGDFKFKYNDVFDKNGKVEKFLDKNKNLIQQYLEEYQKIITTSCFFKNNEDGTSFGTYQAKKLIDSVNGNEFFNASHKIVLSNSEEISSTHQLNDLVNREITRILSDENIKKAFEKIDTAIGSNAELRAFKKVLEADKLLIPYLTDYNKFKRMVWYRYIYELKDEYNKLLHLYDDKKRELLEILDKARAENELWTDIIKIYKQRFFVPFNVSIENQEDVILKSSAANLVFSYEDTHGNAVQRDKNSLIEVLSKGEKRAFFILQLLFELEARKKENKETLVIFDDIADSFDYKNKYAIIEYLSELNKNNLFSLIILTHNFDFYRTVISRLDLVDNIYMTTKDNDSVSLKRGQYRYDFFKNKIKSIKEGKVFISLIPFVRNIVEYTDGEKSEDYDLLTACLHRKSKSANILVKDLKDVYQKKFKACSNLQLPGIDEGVKVFDLIKQVAHEIRHTASRNEIELENKFILAICIRLLAEEYIINKLRDDDFVKGIKEKQTRVLIEEFRKRNPNMKNESIILDRVNMITPEYIHVNSFMYEPLIDTSVCQLFDLYDDVLDLNNL